MAKRQSIRARPRSAEEARNRLLALTCLMWRAWAEVGNKHRDAGKFYGVKIPAAPSTICADIDRARKRHSLDEHLTPLEVSQLDRPLGKLKQYEVERGTWGAEAIRTLAWSLKGARSVQEWPMRDRLSYAAMFYPSSLADKPLPPWLKRPLLRVPAEIERERRIAALWTWRYRAHELIQGGSLNLLGIAALVTHIARHVAAEARSLGLPTKQGDLVLNDIDFWKSEGVNHFVWSAFVYGHPMRHHTLEWLTGRAPDWQTIVLPTPQIVAALRPSHAPRSWEWLKLHCEGRIERSGHIA